MGRLGSIMTMMNSISLVVTTSVALVVLVGCWLRLRRAKKKNKGEIKK